MSVSIAEYADAAGITPRAARMRAAQGRIDAKRIGNTWVIPHHELAAAARDGKAPPGRAISRDAFERLAAFLEGEDEHLTPDQRRQAKRLAARLRVRENLRALSRIGRNRGGVPHGFRASPEDLQILAIDPHLQPTGISDYRQRLSSHNLLEAYVPKHQLRRLRAEYGLSPVSGPAWNVLLRAIDELPPAMGLRASVDLAEASDPRSLAEASRIARSLAEAAL